MSIYTQVRSQQLVGNDCGYLLLKLSYVSERFPVHSIFDVPSRKQKCDDVVTGQIWGRISESPRPIHRPGSWRLQRADAPDCLKTSYACRPVNWGKAKFDDIYRWLRALTVCLAQQQAQQQAQQHCRAKPPIVRWPWGCPKCSFAVDGYFWIPRSSRCVWFLSFAA